MCQNKRLFGTHRAMLENYLAEFLWRQRLGRNPFQNLVEHIRLVYPDAAAGIGIL